MSALFDFSVFPTLYSRRLVLREFRTDDADDVFAIRGDLMVTRYNSGKPYERVEQAVDLIAAMARAYRDQEEVRWAITHRGSNEVIGIIGYNYWIRRDARGSVGYDLARVWWGRGIMTEAVNAVVRFGFDQMHLNRIEADTDVRNPASGRVLEKVGFVLEGRQREQFYDSGGYQDLMLYGLLRKDYLAASPPQGA
jgi:ribosomal-protein-alanine N-acetyltransferase